MKSITELTYKPREEWEARARVAFDEALRARYPNVRDLTDRKSDEKRFQLRVNADTKDGAIPYAALLPPEQDTSGPYGGMSFVIFPSDDGKHPGLIAMGVGTNGLAPDEALLGRPGHARKCSAIASWLNTRLPGSAWAKRDPVRIDRKLPQAVAANLDAWDGARRKYGNYLYATFVPPAKQTDLVTDAITAFIDLFFDERGIQPKKDSHADAARLRTAWQNRLFPNTAAENVHALLKSRRFVIIEGPPGTGKTQLATDLHRKQYGERGRIIQFHPATTYESFVGGLAPADGGQLGFTFKATPGHLMQAATAAANDSKHEHLLVIDEINRADLAKVLGEAIYLFEPGREDRSVQLAHRFEGAPHPFKLPPNLHVLGTMNSADRSIAIMDIAVRRRFAFVPLWPQLEVVERHSGPKLQAAFAELVTLFIDHASEDALPLVPGHAYFLGKDEDAPRMMATSVRPLLEEYLAQGYVAGFADEIRAYLDRYSQVS